MTKYTEYQLPAHAVYQIDLFYYIFMYSKLAREEPIFVLTNLLDKRYKGGGGVTVDIKILVSCHIYITILYILERKRNAYSLLMLFVSKMYCLCK